MGDRLRVQFPVRNFISVCNQPPRSTQPGHPFVGRRNEYQLKGADALRLGVKANMVRVWVAGKTVSALEIKVYTLHIYLLTFINPFDVVWWCTVATGEVGWGIMQ